jgi:amidase
MAARLSAAGAVLLGKTAMSEWAAYRSSTNTTSMGWSGYGGQVLGAYCESQDPFGSSSGSGVAVSVGLALGALGTEVFGNSAFVKLQISNALSECLIRASGCLTDWLYLQTAGSIVGPSSQNNVVGIKPTLGLTSRDLVIPITIRQDTVGPIARTVKEAAMILSAIAGKDSNDNYTSLQPFDTIPDYAKSLNYSAFKGTRIGIPRNGLFNQSVDDSVLMAAFESAIEIMRSAGAEIVDNANFPAFDGSVEASMRSIREKYNYKVIGTDFIAGITSYLAKVTDTDGNQYHSVEELLNCTQSDPREEYPDRDTSSWEQALSYNFTNDSQEVWDAYQEDLYFGREGGVLGALDLYNLDALILPTTSSMYLPALGGLPIINVPLGRHPDDTEIVKDRKGHLVQIGPNTPFGISFMGRAWSEETLIGFAYAFEQRTMVRRSIVPYIVPKTELHVEGLTAQWT